MITYIHSGDAKPIKVRLGNKIIGSIKKVNDGWQYFPAGKKFGGNVFPTLQQCKDSLFS